MSAAAAIKLAPSPDKARQKTCWLGTPEIYFRKRIDNSRLVKVEDPRRDREMRIFGIALFCLFVLVMGYAWQHFKAIEYGYRIEALRSQREELASMNQALHLEEASLRNPARIDAWARTMGLQAPEPGQIVPMDIASEPGSPVLASVRPVAVVSTR